MIRFSIEFDLKNFRFSHELIIGVKSPSQNQDQIQVAHFLDKFDYQILNETEIKVKFSFRLVIAPKVGDYSFDGECILESPEQEKIRGLLKNYPGRLKHAVNRFLLKECYSHAEKLASSESFYFPPTQKILNSFGIE